MLAEGARYMRLATIQNTIEWMAMAAFRPQPAWVTDCFGN